MHFLPRIHAQTPNHKIHANNFSIIDYSRNILGLQRWSLDILKQKPDLNRHHTLHILVTCQVGITLQQTWMVGYIGTQPVPLLTHFKSELSHDMIWLLFMFRFIETEKIFLI